MPVTGLMPLSGLQAAIEAVAGTLAPATRKQPILEGMLKEYAERHYVKEQRGSLIANYRSYQTVRFVEISGMQVALTFEDASWWFQFFLKGGIGSAKTLQTSAAADDIIDCTAHGFVENDPVVFTSLTGGAGLSANTIYYVIAANLATDTFQVSATAGGSAIDFSTNVTAGTVKAYGVGGGAGDAGSPEMYSRVFTPTAGSNDLLTASLEAYNDTQNFAVNYAVGNRIEFGWVADGPFTCSMDWLGQKAALQAKTAALNDRVTEDINGSLGKVYLDDTTIGSTLYAYPLAAKFVVDNKYEKLVVGDGNLYPKEFYRGDSRFMSGEVTLAFDSVAEWNNFITSPIERKARLRIDGSVIHDAVVNRLDIDWYGKYAEGTFGSQNGLKTATFSGESVYNAAAGWDWRLAIQNSLASMP